MMKKIALIILTVIFFLPDYICYALHDNYTSEQDTEFSEKSEELYAELSFDSVSDRFTDTLREAFFPTLKVLCGMIGMILICAVTNSFSVNLNGFDIGSYVSTLCFSGYLFSIISNLCSSVTDYVTKLRDIMLVITPVITAASAADGMMSAATSYTGLALCIAVIEYLVTSVVMPCVKLLFIMATVSGVVGKTVDLRGISSSLRTFTLFFISFLMTAAVTVTYFRNVVARAGDSMGTRAIRFASTNLVPIVGNLLGDSMKTVSESLKAVQSVTGAAGVSAIITAFLPPFVACIVLKIEINICVCMSKTLGCGNEAAFLSDCGGILNILNACLIVATLGFAIMICVVSKLL